MACINVLCRSLIMYSLFVVGPFIPTVQSGYAQPVPLNLDVRAQIEELGNGIRYKHVSSDSTTEKGALSAHVLFLDLDSIRVQYVLALDQILGQEPPTSMVDRFAARAGINGGFSITNDPWQIFHGDPNGFFVLDGEVLSEPVEPRASFGICESESGKQEASIFRPSVTPWLIMPSDEPIRIDGFNRARQMDDIIAYTPEWGRSTITSSDGLEVLVSGKMVVDIVHGGSSSIPEDGFVLSGTGILARDLLTYFQPGDRLALDIKVRDIDAPEKSVSLDGCSYSSAGPRMVFKGKPILTYEEEGFGDHFTFVRHPRTALGIDRSGRTLIVLVVDGRQPHLSVGMTLPELALLMVEQGIHEGYNLDGGGSSIMVIDGEIMNSPSDGKERRRSDGIVFIPRN